jgi:hypothetical protein
MGRNEILDDPRHLGVPSGATKMISEPMECSAQTMHLSFVKITTISKQTKTGFHLSLVTLEYHRVRLKRFLSLWYVWRIRAPILHPHKHHLQTFQNESPHDPRHLGVPPGASKTISEPKVHSAQTLHNKCVKISTISKWTKTSF